MKPTPEQFAKWLKSPYTKAEREYEEAVTVDDGCSPAFFAGYQQALTDSAPQQWRTDFENMPKDGQDFLVIGKYTSPMVLNHTGAGFTDEEGLSGSPSELTYWISLPSAPEPSK